MSRFVELEKLINYMALDMTNIVKKVILNVVELVSYLLFRIVPLFIILKVYSYLIEGNYKVNSIIFLICASFLFFIYLVELKDNSR